MAYKHNKFTKYAIIVLCFVIVADASIIPFLKPLEAFKPKTHVFLGNNVLDSVRNGSVEIDGKSYPIDERIATSITSFPDSFRAGIVGPDGYPDILVGQGSIHPDTRCDNGKESNIAFCFGNNEKSFTHQWLRHVYEGAWHYYNLNQGNDDGKKALAFAYGFLTHAAGDMWSHTLVNSFAGGIFPGIEDIANDPSKISIAMKHIIVESYIGKHTGESNLEIDAPTQFIYSYMIDDSFSDSKGLNSKELGLDKVLDSFIELRERLEREIPALQASYDRCGIGDITCIPILVKLEFSKAWLDDVNDGLRAWPQFSQDVAHALFAERDAQGDIGNVDHAEEIVQQFVFDHLASMLGVPDALVWTVEQIVIINAFVNGLLDPILEPIKQAVKDYFFYIIKESTGIDLEIVMEFIKHPYNYINAGLNVDVLGKRVDIGFAPDTSQKLDALMGITDGTHNTDPFDINRFAAAKNTVTMTKLLLLSPDQLNDLLADNGAPPLYSGSIESSNAMLDFIRSLDANHQWRLHSPVDGKQHGEGMPIWMDCSSRIHVFREIFTDWENGASNFPDLGELCIDRTPPVITVPASPMIVEATSSQGAIVAYSATAVDEIDGSVSINCNPSSGAQFPLGDTIVTCSASDRSGNRDSKEFVVRVQDTTPPETIITSAKEGNNFDVINGDSTVSNEITFRFTAEDKVGIGAIQCSLDNSPFTNCSSPINYKKLSLGNHHFEVQSIDTSGNKDPTPAVFTWKVLTPKQATEKLLSTVNGLTGVNSAVKTSLAVQLNQAIKVLGDRNTSNDKLACIYLGSFITSVNAYKTTGLLTTSQADNLKQQAQAIQKANGCSDLSFGIPGGVILPFWGLR